MTRSEITAALTRLTESHIKRRCWLWASEVIVSGGGRVDFAGFSPYGFTFDAVAIERGELTCYEIKSCMADFESGHGLNFVGDINWLVCPRDLCDELRKSLRLPSCAGVLCPDAGYTRLIETIHQPSPAYRFHRDMPASEAVWRIAMESYGANFEKVDY